MTYQSSAFSNESKSQETPVQEPSQASAFTDQLSKIRNEKGEQKYNNVDTALEALSHSQSYIPQLKLEVETKEAEIRRLTEELSKRAAVEDVVGKLTAQQAKPETTPQVSGLNEQDVLNLVQNFSAQQHQQSAKLSNEKQVSDVLFKQYGEKTQEVVSNKAAELGMTVEALKTLSQTSPQAALQLFGSVSGGSKYKATSGSMSIPSTYKAEGTEVPKPEKSLLRGASTKEQVEYLRKIRENIYQKHNIES